MQTQILKEDLDFLKAAQEIGSRGTSSGTSNQDSATFDSIFGHGPLVRSAYSRVRERANRAATPLPPCPSSYLTSRARLSTLLNGFINDLKDEGYSPILSDPSNSIISIVLKSLCINDDARLLHRRQLVVIRYLRYVFHLGKSIGAPFWYRLIFSAESGHNEDNVSVDDSQTLLRDEYFRVDLGVLFEDLNPAAPTDRSTDVGISSPIRDLTIASHANDDLFTGSLIGGSYDLGGRMPFPYPNYIKDLKDLEGSKWTNYRVGNRLINHVIRDDIKFLNPYWMFFLEDILTMFKTLSRYLGYGSILPFLPPRGSPSDTV